MELIQLVDVMRRYYSGVEAESDYHFFMLLIDHAIKKDSSNPFEDLEQDTLERQIRGRNNIKEVRLQNVLASKSSIRLRNFIKRSYREEQQCDMEKEIHDLFPDFNCEEHDFVYSCSELFYSLVRQYINGEPCTQHKPPKQAKSSNTDGVQDVFEKTYKKEISLSNVLSGIRSEIWKEIDSIINSCKAFKRKTEELNRSIDFLVKASADNEYTKIDSYLPTYAKQREELESLFNEIFRKWGHLYTTYAHIIEIREITQIDFAHLVLIPPDNKMIHVAGDKTNTFIEKLRQLSEEYLFT